MVLIGSFGRSAHGSHIFSGNITKPSISLPTVTFSIAKSRSGNEATDDLNMPEETIDLLVPDGDEEKVIGRSIHTLIHIFFCFSNVMSAIYSMFQEFACILTLKTAT